MVHAQAGDVDVGSFVLPVRSIKSNRSFDASSRAETIAPRHPTHPTNPPLWLLQVVVVPFSDTIEGLKGDLFETFVEPYFKETYRPVRVGDTFLAHGAMRTVEFKVVSVETEEEGEDARYCIVGDETEVEIAEEPLRVRVC